MEERRSREERRNVGAPGGVIIPGLTRKDWVAGQALIGLISHYGIEYRKAPDPMIQHVKDAYEMATFFEEYSAQNELLDL